MVLGIFEGSVLIAIAIAMLFLARSRNGEPVKWLRVYIVGQLYVLAALVAIVMGLALIISGSAA